MSADPRKPDLPYRIDISTGVARQVARLSGIDSDRWNACLDAIAEDPHPRYGTYIEHSAPVPHFSSRTWLFEIVRETSISGEELYVFTSEFFAEYALLFTIDEEDHSAEVFYLRWLT